MSSTISSNIRNRKIGTEETAKINLIIESLEKDPKSQEFLAPVDYIGKLG